MVDLGVQDGLPVLAVGLEIPGVAGGLRDAIAVDPIVHHKGERVHVILEVELDKFRFEPIKDANGWKRVEIMKVHGAAFAPADLVVEHLEAERVRVEKAKGLERLPIETDPDGSAKGSRKRRKPKGEDPEAALAPIPRPDPGELSDWEKGYGDGLPE